MNKKKSLAFVLLLGFILSGVSGFVLFGFADTPPVGATVEVLDWTYFKDPGHSVDAYFNLKLRWTEGGETKVDWVPAFCLDSGIYWSATPDRVVVASDDPDLPSYIDDENLHVINYIMCKWHSNTWPDAGWEEIQYAIWFYSDESMGTGGQYPDYDEDVYDDIIEDVEWDIDHGIVAAWTGPYTVYVLDPGDGEDQNNVQLTFFEIPVVPLGTITSLIAMAGGFLYKKKHA